MAASSSSNTSNKDKKSFPQSTIIPTIFQTFTPIDSPLNPLIIMKEQTALASTRSQWKIPKLRLKVADVCSEGASAFFAAVNAESLLKEAVVGVLNSLYTHKNVPNTVRSVTLILRSMEGVAYTTGSDLDNDHKEIHFSTDYIAHVHKDSNGSRDRDEIRGVVLHEMVHVFQYNGKNTCNGGLIEGIADWVRLRKNLGPPHWKVGEGDNWDEGYQNTAYFLQYLEDHYGTGSVPRINEYLKDHHYSEKLWIDIFHKKPETLWKEYKKNLEQVNRSQIDKQKKMVTVVRQRGSSQDREEGSATPTSAPTPDSTNEESTSDATPVSDQTTDIHNEAVRKFLETTPLFTPPVTQMIARSRLATMVVNVGVLHSHTASQMVESSVKVFEDLVRLADPNMEERDKIILWSGVLQGTILWKHENVMKELGDNATFVTYKEKLISSIIGEKA